MQIKLLISIVLILGICALVTKPLKSVKKAREFVNQLLAAFLTYYCSYSVMYGFGVSKDVGISIGAGLTVLVLVIMNMFFRKPD